MKNILSALCLRSIIDQETNNISLIDCLEQLNIQINESDKTVKDKVFPIAFDFVSIFVDENIKKERKFDFILETVDGKKEKLGEIKGQIVMKEGIKRMRHRIKIPGLKIIDSGTYLFKIKYKKMDEEIFVELAEIPLEVNISYKLM
ncbi:MAG TPA: hypothetical protein VMC41_02150 [Candidatus Nanoarchaeia archaeon]|nr:hypothetical protein [Candidatus Nanoarchaeia archaeon]